MAVLTAAGLNDLESAYARQPLNWYGTNTGYATTANSVTFDVPAGVTVDGNTFVTSGTYTVSALYTDDGYYTRGRKMRDELIEALFTLKPGLAEEYGGDKDAFFKAVVAAAKAKYAADQYDILTDLF